MKSNIWIDGWTAECTDAGKADKIGGLQGSRLFQLKSY